MNSLQMVDKYTFVVVEYEADFTKTSVMRETKEQKDGSFI